MNKEQARLTERLRQVPEYLAVATDNDDPQLRTYRVGGLCHKAAAEIDRLQCSLGDQSVENEDVLFARLAIEEAKSLLRKATEDNTLAIAVLNKALRVINEGLAFVGDDE